MLTRNGWTFAALTAIFFALGVWLGYSELVAIAGALLLCLILAAAWLGRRPRIQVNREIVPMRVQEGDGSAGVLTVTNLGNRRCPPILAVEPFANTSVSVSLPGLAAGASHTTGYRLPTKRRGCYAVGPLVIGNSDPLGLASSDQTYGSEATLWVHPRIHRVSPIPTGRSQDLEGPTSAGAPSGGIAFHSLREYQPGDDLRMIHWRSSAKTGKLMVRHTVITNEPRLLIVLDTSSAPYDDESFEDAVRVAASLMSAGAEKRYPTDFRTTGGMEGTVDPTGRGRTDILDKLAAVQMGNDPGLEALMAIAPRRSQGVALGVVTGQPTREMASVVGRVRGRFEMATMVQLGEKFDRPPMHVPGVLGVIASTSTEFARVWKAKVG